MPKKGFKHSEESKKKMSEIKKSKHKTPWNKGLTKETDERVKRASITMKISDNCEDVKKKHSGDNNVMKNPIVKQKHSESMKKSHEHRIHKIKEAYKRPDVIERHKTAMNRVFSNLAWQANFKKSMKVLHSNENFKKTHAKSMQKKEVREKISLSMKMRWNDPNTRKNLINNINKEDRSRRAKLLWKNNNFRNHFSKVMSNHWSDAEFRKSHSGKNSKLYGIVPKHCNGRGNGNYFYHPDGRRIWLRSSYEIRFATALTTLKINWLYECQSFKLINESPWHPDFYLIEYDLWVEIKGYLRESALRKMREFYTLYPNIRVNVLYLSDIEMIEKQISTESDVDIRNFGTPLMSIVNQ